MYWMNTILKFLDWVNASFFCYLNKFKQFLRLFLDWREHAILPILPSSTSHWLLFYWEENYELVREISFNLTSIVK